MKHKRVVSWMGIAAVLLSILAWSGCDTANSGSTGLRVVFDESKISCRRKSDNWAYIQSGTQVIEGEALSFDAKNLPAGKIADVWTAGHTTRTGFDFYYKVNKQDAVSGIITVSYTERQAERITLTFDESEIICKRGESHESLSSGAQVLEGERLIFEKGSKLADKFVEAWIIGKRESTCMNCYFYVNKKDADSGTLTIKAKTREAEKYTLTFDESKISCQRKSDNWAYIQSGTQVIEGEALSFDAKNLPAGKTVDVWTAGNKTYTEFSFYYEVNKQDVVSGNITVSYTVRPIELLTIEFDNTAITCKTIPDNKPVATGSKQPEGTILELATVSGKAVRWQIGQYHYSKIPRVRVPLHKSRISQGTVLKVSYKE